SKKEKEKKKERDVTYWVNHATRDAQPRVVEEDVESELHVRFAADAKDHDDDRSESGASTDSTASSEPVALDGGARAWSMVFISFLMHFICDGISFSIGIIFHSMQEHFQVSKTSAGVINSFLLSLPLLLSPIAGTFTDIYDCRKTAIGGSMILVLGFWIASFSSNYYLFLFTFAGLGGLGMCFNYNSAVVIVTYYFSTKRSLATACAVSGTGLGTLVISQLLNQTIKYGFQAAMWTCGALAIALLVLVCFMVDVDWQKDSIEYKKKKFDRQVKNGEFDFDAPVKDMVEIAPARRAFSCPNLIDFDALRGNSLTVATSTQALAATVDKNFPRSASVSTFRKKPSTVALNSDYTMLHTSKFDHLDLELGKSPSNTITRTTRKRVSSKTSQSLDALNLEGDLDRTPSSSSSSTVTSSEESNHGDSSSSELSESEALELDEKTKFLTQLNGSVPRPGRIMSARETGRVVPRSSLKPTTATNTMAFTRVPAANAYRYRYDRTQLIQSKSLGSAPNLYVRKTKKRSKGKIIREQFVGSFTETMEAMKRSTTDVYNITYLCSCFIFYFLYDIMYVNLPEYLEEQWHWTSDEASYVIMAISLSNFLGMVVFGLVGDSPKLLKHLFLIIGLATGFAGLPIYLVTLSGNKFLIYGSAVIFGIFISNSYVLASVTIVEINGLSDFQAGYSLLGFVQGFGNLFGPTVIGYARDRLGTYNLIFRLSAFGLAMSGALCLWLYYKIVRVNYQWREFDQDDEESEEGDQDEKRMENGHALPLTNTQRFINTMHVKDMHVPEAYPLFNREV
ncbi:hypothetical protein PMAYCL1PPCAC_31919, partial [Pristionchus mayeri]